MQYCSLTTVMKIQLVHTFIKIRLYKTLIDMVLKYSCDTCRVSKKKQKTFQTLSKGKSSRQIFGSLRENGMWRIRYNE